MLLAVITMLVIDYIYLNVFSKHFNTQVKIIQGSEINLKYIPAFFSYLFLLIGLKYFILDQNKTPEDAFLLGIVIYGVYEMTNKAILDKWNYKSVVIDTLWGGILFYLTTIIYQKYN